MNALEHLIDTYCDGWSAPTPEERERLIRATLADDATYCDPRADDLPVPDLLAHISGVQAKRPGAKVVRTSAVDVHHGFARFHWHVVLPDGTTLPEGLDVVELSPDGKRIQHVLGFFGPLQRRSSSTSN
ncbi:nuclear transport factor 2 family protein [Piscinibacter sp.]|uniref:nuclear transport factor 2 family protein n=1 Tax=Piscinibacter sp. TaxID=1903157 RepID=UPI0039E29650